MPPLPSIIFCTIKLLSTFAPANQTNKVLMLGVLFTAIMLTASLLSPATI
ncbi:MAG: hypothetical protein ACRC3G_03430 [Bacteroidales bacterium]